MAPTDHMFRFVILGRYPARMRGNQTAVTVNMSAGESGRLVHCGTLTMAEAEFATLVGGLEAGLPHAVEVEDYSREHPEA
jgi:hypothetical protein